MNARLLIRSPRRLSAAMKNVIEAGAGVSLSPNARRAQLRPGMPDEVTVSDHAVVAHQGTLQCDIPH